MRCVCVRAHLESRHQSERDVIESDGALEGVPAIVQAREPRLARALRADRAIIGADDTRVLASTHREGGGGGGVRRVASVEQGALEELHARDAEERRDEEDE